MRPGESSAISGTLWDAKWGAKSVTADRQDYPQVRGGKLPSEGVRTVVLGPDRDASLGA